MQANDWTGTPAQLALRFIEGLRAGRAQDAAARFDKPMAEALSVPQLQAAWHEAQSELGPWKAIRTPEVHKKEGGTIVVVPCELERGELAVRVVFDEQRRVSGLWFTKVHAWTPPAYADPSRFEEREVTVGSGPWATTGTLTMPVGEGPFPAVVLVHGSGPNDRDETSGPHKLFKDLAWGLGTRGIAVLRYDKRTLAHREQLKGPARDHFTQKEEYVDDAVEAVALLASVPGIDARRLVVAGHSEGAWLTPRIAEASKAVRAMVLLAAKGRSDEDVVLEQLEYLAGLDGTTDTQERERMEKMRQAFALLASPSFNASTPASELPWGIPAAYWMDARSYDAFATARKVRRPMFVAQGERDYQVTMNDFAQWRTTLQGRKDVVLRSYPRLHHHFMEGKGEGKSTPAEYKMPGHADENLVTDIAQWIQQLK